MAGAAVAAALVGAPAAAGAMPARDVEFALRGQKLTVSVYTPAGAPRGTVIMGSGDVGWVGLSVSMAEFLSDHGYIVIGLNTRQYLSSFRTGQSHLTVEDAPADFRALAAFLRVQNWFVPPVVLSGVSEGAAIAVLGGADAANHDWVDGVITMGVPATAELAWRWTDFTSWISKKDADEPSFSPYDFIAGVAPLPLVMIQSRRDEYVSEQDYRRCHENARDPKKLVLIDASNHRFTDRQAELRREYLAALAWITDVRAQSGGAVR